MNRVLIVVSSKTGSIEDTDIASSLVYQNIEQYDIFHVYNDGKYPLSSIYNRFLTESTASLYEIVLFVHDDVTIQDSMLFKKLYDAVGNDSEYSICGLAGACNCRILEADYNLWHLMSDEKSGFVGHWYSDDKVAVTNFGLTPKRVVLLDGLFLGVNMKRVMESGLKFDENNPSKFHFYDLNFCLEANKRKLKMTTVPIFAIHRSHGLGHISEEFKIGNEYFKKKWLNNEKNK